MGSENKTIIGNWKMHGTLVTAAKLAGDIAAFTQDESAINLVYPRAFHEGSLTVVLCPPLPLLNEVKTALSGTKIALGAQDCHAEAEGAFTGDVSAPMLKSAGCDYVIVGHSERRQHYKETSGMVCRKAEAAMAAGLKPVICIGETKEERKSGKAEEVVGKQLAESIPKSAKGQFLLAYEPVWAIGSGETPSRDDIARMHAYIAAAVPRVAILYGGSVKSANAREILSIKGVSGALVGGASLKAEEFCRIIEAAE